MDKLTMQSMDNVQYNLKRIRELFPNAVTEVIRDGKVEYAVDFDVLRQELSSSLIDEKEMRYQFTWPDKNKSILLANTPTKATLRPCREESVDFDNTENLYIEGDNLEVLKLLQETYLGKIKMIYIDPPYNTGNDFVYEDDFAQATADYLENSGQYDEQGNRMVQNTESNGRFHTDWLNMIYPRLRLAKDLLSDDGVIFISIDDNEQDNLKKICDEIFGEKNFIANFIWQQGMRSTSNLVNVNHEYCLVVAKNREYISKIDIDENKFFMKKKQGINAILTKVEELKARCGKDYDAMTQQLRLFYKSLPQDSPVLAHKHYNCIDERGVFFPADCSAPDHPETRCHTPLIHPITKKGTLVPKSGWRYSWSTLQKLVEDNRIYYGENENRVPCLKRYLIENQYEQTTTVFYKDGRGASNRLESLFGGKIFPFPKDETIIKNFISYASNNNGIILDFFSGSATTAHAVMQLNAEDGGKRKFIMVQLPEQCDEKSEAYKAGYKTICEIGKERIRRAGAKIKEENPLATKNLDTGFRVLKLDSSNMKEVFYKPADYNQTLLDFMENNIKEDRTSEDLLFQVMLEFAKPLSAKIEEKVIAGKKVYIVDDNDLICCFEENVTDEVVTQIAKLQPLYAVFRDSTFSSDSVAANFEQIFATYSPNTKRKVL